MTTMGELVPKNVKSTKSREVIAAAGAAATGGNVKPTIDNKEEVKGVPSHFLVPPEVLEKVTRRVVAPYAQIERKGIKDDEAKEGTIYLDINRFNVFMEDTIDLDTLFYETALVLKTVTYSSGVFVYIVNKSKNEIVLMAPSTKNPKRHEVNIPIGEGQMLAAHVAFTKELLVIEDVQRDRRFSEGLKWVDAKVALCIPVVKPNGDCYAVLELFKTVSEPYNSNQTYTAVCVACWAGAAVHQAQARLALQKAGHLNAELLTLLEKYFSDLASFDTMITDMLAVVKSFLNAMRSSFYIIERDPMQGHLTADMWDDGWSQEKTTMPRKKTKIDLSTEQSPAGLVARTCKMVNVKDAYYDTRFNKEIDPTTGTVVRATVAAPIMGKEGIIAIVQVTNKRNAQPFTEEDENIFKVFLGYCSLIVHFSNMQRQKEYHENLNKMCAELMTLHMVPCRHEFDELVETNFVIIPPSNFRTYEYHISEGTPEEMPGLVLAMFFEAFADKKNFDRPQLADFVLTVLNAYRNNFYHNAEHAFTFTHTMFMILMHNTGYFDFAEVTALMIAGLCHDIDHPGLNNNFLILTKHPLAKMYRTSTLEYHHYHLTRKIINDKGILLKLSQRDRDRIMDEIKYAILCTDLAIYFQIRAQLTPIVAEQGFDWMNSTHRKLIKGILMTTSDLSGCSKPFGISKVVAEKVYAEFYDQGDRERALGYTPLSMMDRRRSTNQPAEQIQFLSVVVLPCLMLLQNIFPNTSPLLLNCRKTQDAWREEIEIRGQNLWRQEDSVPTAIDRSKGNKSNKSVEVQPAAAPSTT